jgi:hypothetical protein
MRVDRNVVPKTEDEVWWNYWWERLHQLMEAEELVRWRERSLEAVRRRRGFEVVEGGRDG